MDRDTPSPPEDAFDGIDQLPASVDRDAVERMRLVARALDDAVTIPGTDFRIGIDPVVGLLPVSGDVASGALSLYIVAESARLGVSPPTLARMLANVTLDVAGGSIPYAGTVFDATWKANKRNFELALRDLAAEERVGAASGPVGSDDDDDDGPVEIDIE